ncbi:Na+ dependent nucleoside transporter domain protein [Chthoniobacter flavus Ellin428]|uniref:Na+ dependent nucleoside transporter domain protein n=1 Tax=Chthoniobacter flavus Ellin428 TaxID=497964 RepID=B4CTV5_9BACT|nr:nucleoside transporter C-terminal domain-containing protein [Chthoniobacter flavus]EDY21993.1 Na+ dependent nucleoside transporter domain protein [Chthoniobacter flavus Ellin428]TCO89380.1 CNT family concentrative nucleoside transporter [Chthoniobacter flavus]
MLRLISLLGIVVFLALAWLLSNNRRLFPWRTVLWGLGLQFFFALFILKTPIGRKLFDGAQTAIGQLNESAFQGAALVFGPLAQDKALSAAFGPENAVILVIKISATIIFISSLSSLLYHWGILQRVVAAMAWVMQKAMRTSGSESLAGASNIFLGQTEAALVIKPYLAKMTQSEVMALMTTGMATIASGVMAVYAGMKGVNAGHIVTASVLGAPAGLLVAKVMFPETEKSETGQLHHFQIDRKTINSIDALCQGASEGIMLSINVMGMLIAFVAMVALLNILLTGLQSGLGVVTPVTLQKLLGWVNAPFAWMMGMPAKDCGVIGQMLGERIVLNEFVGYLDLSNYVQAHPGALAERSVTLASYALCGFANFGSIAIQIGGIGALAPNRRHDLARLGPRAMIAGLIACYLFASVIGVLID